MNLRTLRLALAVVLATIAVVAPLARAACSYYPMTNGTTYLFITTPQNAVATMGSGNWSLFACNAVMPGEDWDLRLYQNTAADPACVANPLATSTAGTGQVDVIVGDWTHNAAGDYYPQASRFYGGGAGALAQWKNSNGTLTLNGMFGSTNFTASDLAVMWTIDLTGGVPVSIDFHSSKLDASYSPKLLVFRNPGTGSYFAGRGAAIATLSSADTLAVWTPPATGTYAMVFVNDGGGHGQVSLAVGNCDAITLTPGVMVPVTHWYSHLKFNATTANWGTLGVKSDQWIGLDYYTALPASPFPGCFGTYLGQSSTSPPNIAGVMGNFRLAATGTYGVDVSAREGSNSRAVWRAPDGTLAVNGAPASMSLTADDFIRTYEVTLVAGVPYAIAFDQSGTDLRMEWFSPDPAHPMQGIYGTPIPLTECHTLTPSISGTWAVIVTNGTESSATATLGIAQAPCDCPSTIAYDLPVTMTATDSYWRVDPRGGSWNVIATRGTTASDDWDLGVYSQSTGAAAPTCFGSLLTSSAAGVGTVDMAVIDAAHTPVSRYFIDARRYAGTSGVVEWDYRTGTLYENMPFQEASFTANDLIDTYIATMTAGTTYQIDTWVTPGSGAKFLVFENTAGGAYAVGRSQAKLMITTNGSATYTATATGTHTIVFVNDAGTSGVYRVHFGSCTTPTALTTDTPQTASHTGQPFTFAPVANGWAAIGALATYDTHGISVWNATGTSWPGCGTGLLGSSAVPSMPFVNFVVGDFWHNAARTYWASVDQTSGTVNESTPVEWSSGTTQVVANDNAVVTATLGGNQVLKAYSTYLLAGRTFRMQLSHTGSGNLHALLFRNVGGGTYWAPRDSACLDVAAGGYGSYTSTQSGWYGIVVVDDDAATDTYTLGLWTCWDASPLSSGVAGSVTPADYVSFTQSWYYWTAIGVRSTSDWDIVVNSSPTGADPPACQSGILATSTGVGVADFVVGDFNSGANPLGTYYAHLYRFAGTGYGSVEWDSDHDLLVTSGGSIRRTFSGNQVLDCSDVRLVAGQAYNISFTRSPGLDAKVLLFRNAAGGAYWAGRGAAVYAASGNGTYTAPSTGYYGLVVVNDNGAEGQYDLGVSAAGVESPPRALPSVTSLHGVSPNPARGSTRVDFALNAPARVRIEALDLAGRVIARIEESDHAAGEWSATWDGRTIAGQRAAPGVYLVRMLIDDRVIGQRKLALVD